MRFSAEPLNENEIALRDEVREFMKETDFEVGLGINAEASFEFSKAVAAKGWLGMVVPPEYGGPGRSSVDRFIVVEQMLAAGAPISAHWVADRQTAQMLLSIGTDEQKRTLLPRIVSGDIWLSLGMSEPGSGSDLASVRTRADRVDGGWVVNGQKVWTSGAQYADYIITLCRTSEMKERKHEGLSQLMIDAKAPGVTVRPLNLLNGFHHFNEVFFEDVFVPDSNVIGEIGQGWSQVTSELAHERSGPDRFLTAMPVLSEYFEQVRGSDLSEQHLEVLGSLFATYFTLRNMSLSIARALDRGELPNADAALIKDIGTRFELDVIRAIRQLHDAELDPTAENWEALLADAVITAPTFTLRGGTNEVLRGIIAKNLIRQGGVGA